MSSDFLTQSLQYKLDAWGVETKWAFRRREGICCKMLSRGIMGYVGTSAIRALSIIEIFKKKSRYLGLCCSIVTFLFLICESPIFMEGKY